MSFTFGPLRCLDPLAVLRLQLHEEGSTTRCVHISTYKTTSIISFNKILFLCLILMPKDQKDRFYYDSILTVAYYFV